MRNIKFYAILLVLVVFAGFFSLSPTLSSIMSEVVIRSSGQISGTEVIARSGSPQDIQTAVDAVLASGGGIVYVPEGDWVFNIPSNKDYGVEVPGGVSIIGAGKDVTILRMTQPFAKQRSQEMIHVDGSNMKPARISGISFIGNMGSGESNIYGLTGVGMYNCKNFRVDHCKFVDFSNAGASAYVYTNAVNREGGEYQYYWNWGVIDHCDFDQPYKDTVGGDWGYGVEVHGPGREDAWLYNLSDIVGQFPETPPRCALYQWNAQQQKYVLVAPYGGKYFRWLVYIEDCTFSRCRHAIASSNEAFYVARYNTFKEPRPENFPMVDVHGALSIDWWGGRGAEIYNNTIDGGGYDGSCAIDYRGGGGVVFNNTIIDCGYGVRLSYDAEQLVCYVKDLWIWNNNYQNVEVPIHHWHDPSPYEEEVHYFLRARPNYAPYPYPHPLAL